MSCPHVTQLLLSLHFCQRGCVNSNDPTFGIIISISKRLRVKYVKLSTEYRTCSCLHGRKSDASLRVLPNALVNKFTQPWIHIVCRLQGWPSTREPGLGWPGFGMFQCPAWAVGSYSGGPTARELQKPELTQPRSASRWPTLYTLSGPSDWIFIAWPVSAFGATWELPLAHNTLNGSFNERSFSTFLTVIMRDL